MAAALDLDHAGDDLPWRGLLAGRCIGATLPGEGLPNIVLRPRAWQSLGQPCEPQIGAAMVFRRSTLSSGKGRSASTLAKIRAPP